MSRRRLAAITLMASCSAVSLLGQRSRIPAVIDEAHRVTLAGHIHPKARAENDQGRVEPSLVIPRVTLVLKPSATQQADLDRLLAEQQDIASPNFHHWLTPEEYADRFGVSTDDLSKIVSWLQDQGFTAAPPARGRNWVAFSGTAAQVESAFHIEIHHYMVNGVKHFANASEPSIPGALGAVVAGIHGLNDFRFRAPKHVQQSQSKSLDPNSAQPDYNSGGGSHYLAPDDLAGIYNIKPLYSGGYDGSGQKLVVVGQSAINLTDLQQFRTYFNLAPNDPQIVLLPNTTDPGIVKGDEGEADLDLEWSAAVARNATVIYVYAKDVTDAVGYAIDQNLAPVISMSYGLCEQDTSSADAATLQSWARQANAQGTTWFAASGDAGAIDCNGDGNPSTNTVLAVDLPASLPEVTGVGGTTFNEGAGNYWNSSNDTNKASALSYIPEITYNDHNTSRNPSASGGGASVIYAKPSWQTGTGVPSNTARNVPDVSLTGSADHDGYMVYSDGSIQVVGGTSAPTPVFAGIAALLNHYSVSNRIQPSAGMGNINPRLYALAQTTSDVFHDITSGDNIINVTCSLRARDCTPGPVGYTAGPGYDQVTGLGSVDVHNLITEYAKPGSAATPANPTITVAATPTSITTAGSTVLSVTVGASNGGTPTGTVTFQLGATTLGTATLRGTGGTATATLTISGSQLRNGSNTITAQYSGDSAYNSTISSVTITVSTAGSTGNPVISSVTNGASFKNAYAPGMILSVFGSQLSPATQSAGAVPLPVQLAGVSATINGISAPLYYVSPGQLNIQVPYEVRANATAVVQVNNNGHVGSFSFAVATTAPGIFVNQSGAPVPSTTATRGQTVTLYITGDGAVSPTLATGSAPLPGTPLNNLPKAVQTVTVMVAGVPAAIQFIGITPGLVGVTQINYQVPTGIGTGNQPVVVIAGNASSTPATLQVTQ